LAAPDESDGQLTREPGESDTELSEILLQIGTSHMQLDAEFDALDSWFEIETCSGSD
jgi:hypothetical protein